MGMLRYFYQVQWKSPQICSKISQLHGRCELKHKKRCMTFKWWDLGKTGGTRYYTQNWVTQFYFCDKLNSYPNLSQHDVFKILIQHLLEHSKQQQQHTLLLLVALLQGIFYVANAQNVSGTVVLSVQITRRQDALNLDYQLHSHNRWSDKHDLLHHYDAVSQHPVVLPLLLVMLKHAEILASMVTCTPRDVWCFKTYGAYLDGSVTQQGSSISKNRSHNCLKCYLSTFRLWRVTRHML